MRIQIFAPIVALGMLAGCGKHNGNSTPSAQAIQSVDMVQLKQSVNSAQASMKSAQAALGNIFASNGSFNWTIFFGGVDFSKMGADTKTCLFNAFPRKNVALLILTAPQDIASALKCILDDVAATAGIAKTDLDQALTILNAALLQTPAGSPDVAALKAMIAEIQKLENSFSAEMKLLANQMNVAITFLNQLPTLTTGAVPIPILSIILGMTVSDFVQPIVAEIMHFQSQLQAL